MPIISVGRLHIIFPNKKVKRAVWERGINNERFIGAWCVGK